MRCVAGLGNPGEEYRGTRHNAGQDVVVGLARRHDIRLVAGRGDFLAGAGRIGGHRVELMLPLTYMNASGIAVSGFLRQRGLAARDLIVVCDDVNLDLGQIRIRRAGGDGGHNGLASIVEHLGTEGFARLRLGIGAPPDGMELAEYVLGALGDGELTVYHEMRERAMDAVEQILTDGIDAAMNKYNTWPRPSGHAEC